MSDRMGKQFGHYRLMSLLGKGGFAEVYLGQHVYLDTHAAIKVMDTELTSEYVELFRTEARNLARLIHPHIVRLLDFGIEDTMPYLVMDYAPHGTLRRQYARGAQLPVATVISHVRQVAEALQFAHDEKLVHRDVKPENMLLGRNNEILLSDFGIAVVAHSTRSLRTQDDIGTVSYMAPEQLQKKSRPASDQYALGVIAYEWLTGTLPFTGAPIEVAMQHLTEAPPPLRQIVPTLSPAIEQVVLRALTKDPEKRFDSIREFARALEQASYSETAPTVRASFPNIMPPSPNIVSPPLTTIPVGYQPMSGSTQKSNLQKTKDQWKEEGDNFFESGNYSEAAKSYTQAIMLDSRDATLYNDRGSVYYELGEYRLALDDYNRATELDRDYTVAYYNRGNAFESLQMDQQAMTDYTMAIQLNPKYAEAYNNRGYMYYKMSQYQWAIKDYNRALELDPNFAGAYENRGLVYSVLEQFPSALRDFDRSIILDPENSITFYYRGNVYCELQNYRQAIEDYNRSLAIDPQDAMTYNSRGIAYFELRQYALAMQDYDRALAIEPNNTTIRNNRERAYQMLRGQR